MLKEIYKTAIKIVNTNKNILVLQKESFLWSRCIYMICSYEIYYKAKQPQMYCIVFTIAIRAFFRKKSWVKIASTADIMTAVCRIWHLYFLLTSRFYFNLLPQLNRSLFQQSAAKHSQPASCGCLALFLWYAHIQFIISI